MNLNQVTVGVSDVGRAIEFYRKLGLRLIVEDLPGYARFECPDGDATFSVERNEQNGRRGTTVYFECADVDTSVAALETEGFVFDSRPENRPWLWREARLRDPDGNQICLFNAGENRKRPPWRVKEAETVS